MSSLDEINEANRRYFAEAVKNVRERGGNICTAFWNGERGYKAHEYDIALRSRLAQYPVVDGCYMIPVMGGDGTGEIANMLETLSRELVEARGSLSDASNIGRWVSTGERLPEDGQMVLGYWPATSFSPVSMEALTYLASDSEVDGRDAWRDYADEDSDAPTHWMPLPEAPK